MTHLEMMQLRDRVWNYWGLELRKEEDRGGLRLTRMNDRVSVYVDCENAERLEKYLATAEEGTAFLAGLFLGAVAERRSVEAP